MFASDGTLSQAFLQSIQKPGDFIFSGAPLAEDANRLLCDGREVAQVDYPSLYAAIANTWGTPSSGSTFKLPDCRARFPVGIGSFPSGAAAAIGVTGGEEKHILAGDEFIDGDHQHVVGKLDGSSEVSLYVKTGTATPAISGSGKRVKGSGSDVTADLTTLDNDTAISFGVNDPPTIVGHNNVPPYFPAYVYVKT